MNKGPSKGPDYRRVVRLLSDEDLAQEYADGKGGPGFQEAVRAELEARVLRKQQQQKSSRRR